MPASDTPQLWFQPPGVHPDDRIAWWVKLAVMGGLVAGALLWLDGPVIRWVEASQPMDAVRGDVAREIKMLEQFGQYTCTVLILAAVALVDKDGRRKVLAIALGCVASVLVCYALKFGLGRARPDTLGGGNWEFHFLTWGLGSKYQSMPSAHTMGAFALAAGLTWFYPRARALFYGLALVTAGLRVLNKAHFPSDALLGMTLAITTVRLTLWANPAGRLLARLPAEAQRWWARG